MNIEPPKRAMSPEPVEVFVKKRPLLTAEQWAASDENTPTPELVMHRNKGVQTNMETPEADLTGGFLVNTQFLDEKYHRNEPPVMVDKEITTNLLGLIDRPINTADISLVVLVPRETVIRTTPKKVENTTTTTAAAAAATKPIKLEPVYGHECPKCRQMYEHPYLLEAHKPFHRVTRAEQRRSQNYSCQFCPKQFTVNFKLLQHLEKEHVPYLICCYCSMELADRSELTEHYLQVHGVVHSE